MGFVVHPIYYPSHSISVLGVGNRLAVSPAQVSPCPSGVPMVIDSVDGPPMLIGRLLLDSSTVSMKKEGIKERSSRFSRFFLFLTLRLP